MKVLIARMNHETNTFSPVPTPLASFGNEGPTYDRAAYEENEGKRTAMSAFIDAAEARGATLVTPLSATAYPSGPVDAHAYDLMCDRIVSAAAGCDAILLDLHGAMVAQNTDDGEGDLLARVRAAAPGVPTAVALDLHANVTQKMIDNADVIVSFKTYPHIDMYETGEHAARLLFASMAPSADGTLVEPVLVWHQLPLVSHTLRTNTAEGAMRDAIAAARAAEATGMLAVSVLSGFGLADIPRPCLSVVVVGNGDRAAAQAVADRLAREIWDERAGFFYDSEPLETSLERARALAKSSDRPILLLDHGDNCMSGGTCDTMDVLHAALEAGLDGIQVGLICDPEAVEALHAAGSGASITLEVGNKRATPKFGRMAKPLSLTGKVGAVTDGYYVISGPTYTGQMACMGRSAVLDIGQAKLVITERNHEPWDLGVFESVGLDPRSATYLLIKSRMYCRPVFVPISGGLIECDSPGVTTSDYGMFDFKHLLRPVYPMDPDIEIA